MTIQWSLFVPGVLLLLLPADRLLSAKVELRSFDCFQNLQNSPRHRPWWWVPALWLDPLRGFVGTFLLLRGLSIELQAWRLSSLMAYILLLVVLTAGLLSQMFTRRGDRGVLLAPMGFVGGVAMALTPWPVALIGIVTAMLGLFALRQFHWFFAFGFVAVALLGFLMDTNVVWYAPVLGLFALPIVLSLVTDSTFEIPTRNDSGPAGTVTPVMYR